MRLASRLLCPDALGFSGSRGPRSVRNWCGERESLSVNADAVNQPGALVPRLRQCQPHTEIVARQAIRDGAMVGEGSALDLVLKYYCTERTDETASHEDFSSSMITS